MVRIGVEVEPRDEAAFLGTVGGQPWQTQSLGEGRYDVRVAVSGATLGSTRAALAEFHRTLNRDGAGVRVLFAARLRPRLSPSRRYLVMPRGWMTERRWLAAPVRGLMAWRARGTIQAASLAEAGARLADFADRNPEAGSPDDLTVVGPPDRPGATSPAPDAAPVDLLDDWRFLLATALLIGAGAVAVGLRVTVWRPEGITLGAAIAFLVAIPCLFGVWQMLRRIPEGRINTWLPLGLTALAAPSAIALSNFSQDVYLEAFGISSGEVTPTGAGRLFALGNTLPLVLFALLVSLGLFGLLQYFHLSSRGHFRLLQWLMVVIVVVLYGLTAVVVLLERDTERGLAHVADYQDEGGPAQSYVGVRPSVVCVEPGKDPVNRIGPPLTTDRPVLYFGGANNVDLLWDREEGLTKVTRFSVSLTPVTNLNSDCPEPEAAE
ncbi:hypothetical protein [Nocardiopsis terrae]|uniref:hypothetical protein n=1 Tax=Nocardiopsis terrae TaxID=372655 RepID=UPI001E641873|nr:hypothetical protein [Nocardiopsis terrae]